MNIITSQQNNNANSKTSLKTRKTRRTNRNLYQDQVEFLLALNLRQIKEKGRWVSESETLRDVIDDYILRTTPEVLEEIKKGYELSLMEEKEK